MARRLKVLARATKHFARSIAGRDIFVRKQIKCDKTRLGDDRAQWCVCEADLSANSVVYSFGVGENVSFELEMIRRFRMRVDAFDPTPRSIAWANSRDFPREFVFHAYGIAEYDGDAQFNPPVNDRHVSYTVLPRGGTEASVKAPVKRLATITEILGHRKVDVLKMDIEGAEYGVIRDLVSSGIEVQQLLVEFHHRWPSVGIGKTKEALQYLSSAGYKIFDVSASGEEYGFKKQA